ncbi:hypothetical protein APR50_17150 [Variovorax paradoxus]|jgi:phage gp36-like protein|uniref:gp436 family protein n=1 Tax=Variovorax paradoxus TaxID=34073 RepID=UPI0006E720A5|nr:hypothetical protein APR52_32655 [Variovorax paradoxus]KPV06264.1 hypothetical protein APR50_17150 [Variovorax paradoxus]KPV06748.1 hypothetical protein APR49_19170 [Variovorax paradoxus]KPV20799.1 hypothetical protein APR51_15880 [Variovorax paradoxus]KPV32260.1 hypothetical protein APR48_14215 [Variovorax paradoxus]
MTYITATAFLERFGAHEIAQRVDRGTPRRVTAELLIAVAASADLSGYPPEAVAAAAVALIVVQRALNDARDTIDSNISPRYPLPISPVPAVLERTAGDLARYYLYDDRVTEPVKDRYDDAMKYLVAVRDGKAQLGADGATGAQPPSSAGAELVSGGRVWNRGSGNAFV